MEQGEDFGGRQSVASPRGIVAYRVPDAFGSVLQLVGAKPATSRLVGVEGGRFRRSDKLHVGKVLQKAYIAFEHAVGSLTFGARLDRWQLPLFARWVGAGAKIDAVPEL